MAESTVVYTPENNGGSIPAWMAMNNNGLFGGNGWGGGILGFFLGLLFGNGWGGWGNGFGGFGGGNGAGFLSNQISNDSGRELLMNAITSQGDASRTATQNLATMVGQDFNLVNGAVQTLQTALSSLALQQAGPWQRPFASLVAVTAGSGHGGSARASRSTRNLH